MANSFTITAHGHPALLGTHRTTLELTRKDSLTTRGDCIIGVGASAGCTDLPSDLKEAIFGSELILVRLIAGTFVDEFTGQGDPALTLVDPHDIVFRKSSFASPRTILVRCTKAACDIDRNLIESLQNPDQEVNVTLSVVST
ncbi:MAG TPA: DUF371 domain-containing protein [Candidatus Lokiarchaeia archaeon]|nr:DUF371 domain-containing protein [Candidatus Lokiarchaeia archaeon]